MTRVNTSCWTPLVIGLLAAPATFAQGSADDQWRFVVEPYVMFPNVNGTVGLDNLPDVSVDQSPSDLFKHLQFGGRFLYDVIIFGPVIKFALNF